MSQVLIFIVSMAALFFFVLLPPKTQQSNAEAALQVWMQGCKLDDIHQGITEDERGTRAFIVTCSPAGRSL